MQISFDVESTSFKNAEELASEIYDSLDLDDFSKFDNENELERKFSDVAPEALKDSILIYVYEGKDDGKCNVYNENSKK